MPTDAEIAVRRAGMQSWYAEAYHRYRRIESHVAGQLERALRQAHLDEAKVDSRTKTVASFVDKACKVAGTDFKYTDPQRQVTDFVGLRVTVPLVTEVPPVSRLLDELFVVVEESDTRPGVQADVPGYQSRHLLVRMRPEVLADPDFRDLGDPVVEIQVRTILQHAWAALQHDLMYKTEREPTDAVRRRLVSLAGLLELAEREFVMVRQAHGEPTTGMPPAAPEVSTTASSGLGDHVTGLAGPDELVDGVWLESLLEVLRELGITRPDELDAALAGRDVREAVSRERHTRPWASVPYVVDLLLRESLGDDYLARRASTGAAR